MKKISKSKPKKASGSPKKDLVDQIFGIKQKPRATGFPRDIKDIKNGVNFLSTAYSSLIKYVEGERNRVLSMQTFIGEAVTQELLHQSYGIPEYNYEERLKRFIACVSKAIKNFCEARNKYPDLKNYNFEGLWSRSDDPHTIKSVYERDNGLFDSESTRIDTSAVHIKGEPIHQEEKLKKKPDSDKST